MGLFLGVDVGTGSARAGLFTRDGRLIATAKRDIQLWRDVGGYVEQSSEDIWSAICASVRETVKKAGAAASDVKAIGFDATCSLVILDKDNRPLAASPEKNAERNIIVWMDHRAHEQAERINASGHPVLQYVGGKISPEMETPKLLWLKEQNPQTYNAAAHFFDLADYLTYRATGSNARSLCTVVCKWTYLGHENRWDEDYFRIIGLDEFVDEGFTRIGTQIVDIATPLADGLTVAAASDLGLLPGTIVGAAAIDAHAGGIGTLASRKLSDGNDEADKLENRLALILGTSACSLNVTREPAFVDGVWGPYWGAMLPKLWLNEGGQSAFGAALDHLLNLHPYKAQAEAEADARGMPLLGYLEEQAISMAGGIDQVALLAKNLHVVPEFLGNRAPDADPYATAIIAGLTLDVSLESLVKQFVAGMCGLAYGTADILDALTSKDIHIHTLIVSGGAAKSAVLRRIMADATGMEIALPTSEEPVLLGGAIIAAAALERGDLGLIASQMSAISEVTKPACKQVTDFHAVKRKIYSELKAVNKNAMKLIEGLG